MSQSAGKDVKMSQLLFLATLVLSYHQQQSGLHGGVLIASTNEEVIMSTFFPFFIPFFLQLLVAIVVLSYEWQASLLVRMSRLAGG